MCGYISACVGYIKIKEEHGFQDLQTVKVFFAIPFAGASTEQIKTMMESEEMQPQWHPPQGKQPPHHSGTRKNWTMQVPRGWILQHVEG